MMEKKTPIRLHVSLSDAGKQTNFFEFQLHFATMEDAAEAMSKIGIRMMG